VKSSHDLIREVALAVVDVIDALDEAGAAARSMDAGILLADAKGRLAGVLKIEERRNPA
jgi:hypothetical protein